MTTATDTRRRAPYNHSRQDRRVDFDVIVAGAGAGGAAAAYYLGQAGLTVLVIDKARLPRYKACGGAIPQATLARFPFSFEPVIETMPASVRFCTRDQPDVDIAIPAKPMAMVMRDRFDALLLKAAAADVLDGISVSSVTETGSHVQVRVGDRAIRARYLIGADGATSTVARSLGLRKGRQLASSLEAEIPVNDSRYLRDAYGDRAVFSLSTIPWGYAWVFPKGRWLSVGIAQFRKGRVNLRAALEQEMDRLGINVREVKVHGHPLPCYQAPPWPMWRGQPQEKLSTQRCLLVGDAAGLVDPLIGEGIRYAITSAQLAAEAIVRDDLSGYEATIWREIGHSLATAGLTAEWVYRLPGLSYQLGVRNSATIRQFVAVMIEESTYEGIGRRILAATAKWLLSRGRTQKG